MRCAVMQHVAHTTHRHGRAAEAGNDTIDVARAQFNQRDLHDLHETADAFFGKLVADGEFLLGAESALKFTSGASALLR